MTIRGASQASVAARSGFMFAVCSASMKAFWACFTRPGGSASYAAHSLVGKYNSWGMKDAYCCICGYVMFPSVVTTGMLSPLWAIPLNTVPIGAPVLQAIKACGFAAAILAIWAATL